MELDEVTLSIADGVGEIVLNRPDQLNPISARAGGTRDQIIVALEQCEADRSVGCVLIRGAGKAFSAGGDLTGNVFVAGGSNINIVTGYTRNKTPNRFNRPPEY